MSDCKENNPGGWFDNAMDNYREDNPGVWAYNV